MIIAIASYGHVVCLIEKWWCLYIQRFNADLLDISPATFYETAAFAPGKSIFLKGGSGGVYQLRHGNDPSLGCLFLRVCAYVHVFQIVSCLTVAFFFYIYILKHIAPTHRLLPFHICARFVL